MRTALLLFAALISPGAVLAQGAVRWPSERPIRLIVPFQAGSSSDTIARIVGQKLSERLGQQIVVDNRVGASSMLGTEAIARSQPDGYTLGIANTTPHASAPALAANPSYDPVKDFAPVAMIGNSPFVLLSAPKLQATDMAKITEGEYRSFIREPFIQPRPRWRRRRPTWTARVCRAGVANASTIVQGAAALRTASNNQADTPFQ